MTATMNHTTQLTVQECCVCHVLFGMPKSWDDELQQSHARFFCPAGHGQSYTGKSEADKLREKLAKAEEFRLNAASRAESAEAALSATQDQLGAATRSLRGQKGANTRLKNRIAKGICPCCKRTFQNLHRHMEGQHPDFPKTDPTTEKSN